jgi:hypothetical protein
MHFTVHATNVRRRGEGRYGVLPYPHFQEDSASAEAKYQHGMLVCIMDRSGLMFGAVRPIERLAWMHWYQNWYQVGFSPLRSRNENPSKPLCL